MDRGGEEAGLARSAVRAMVVITMSAAEVIEMIKKLPPKERAEVDSFLAETRASIQETSDRFATDADFDRAAKQVFADNHELLRRLAQ